MPYVHGPEQFFLGTALAHGTACKALALCGCQVARGQRDDAVARLAVSVLRR
jgi:hypothetical protein